MIFKVNPEEAEVTCKSAMVIYQNRIRKAWVSAVKGTTLEIRLLSYSRKDRFELYAHIDECIRVAYVENMRQYKKEQMELGNYSTSAILGSRILCKTAQRNLDDVLYDVTESTLIKLLDTIKLA